MIAPAASDPRTGGDGAPRGPVSRRDRVARLLAVWFGCGYVPRAPGTAGTLGAIPLYLAVRPLGIGAITAAAVVLTTVGIWASAAVVRTTGQKDPQIVCIDEVAGVMITWIAAPATWPGLVAGLALFRVLDMWKPWPARLAERRLPGGFGVMLDDVYAGLWGAGILLALRAAGVM